LIHLPVIPAKAGNQAPKFIPCCLDTGFRRYDGESHRLNANAFGIIYQASLRGPGFDIVLLSQRL